MNTNVGSPAESPQNIKDINAIFNRLETSRSPNILKTQRRLYLVIDTQTQMLGLTFDKKNASSLKQVARWINEFTQKTLSSDSVSREEIKNLRERCSIFAESLPETLFQKTLNLLFDYRTEKGAAKETCYTLDDRLADYGKRQRQRVLVDLSDPNNPIKHNQEVSETISYATHGEMQANSKDRVKNSFEKIKDLEKPDEEEITEAFNDELGAKLSSKWASDRAIHKLVTGVFQDLLNQFSKSQGEWTPEELLADFKKQLGTAIEKRNHVSESIDRDTFRDLIGEKVNDGKRKPADDINLSSQGVKKLIEEYNNGNWLPNEERLLEYDVMNTDDKDKLQKIVEPILNSEAFDTTIINYFKRLKEV